MPEHLANPVEVRRQPIQTVLAEESPHQQRDHKSICRAIELTIASVTDRSDSAFYNHLVQHSSASLVLFRNTGLLRTAGVGVSLVVAHGKVHVRSNAGTSTRR